MKYAGQFLSIIRARITISWLKNLDNKSPQNAKISSVKRNFSHKNKNQSNINIFRQVHCWISGD